jgi:hypothetical protein
MKKKLALALLLAAAGGAFLFGAGAPSILSPQPPAPSAGTQATKRASSAPNAAAPRRDSGEVLKARGKIVKVYLADKKKKTAEWIVLLVGKRRLSVVVFGSTPITDGKGSRLRPILLKAGETVDLSYRQSGKTRTALAIRV